MLGSPQAPAAGDEVRPKTALAAFIAASKVFARARRSAAKTLTFNNGGVQLSLQAWPSVGVALRRRAHRR